MWKRAMEEEFQALIRNCTFDLVPLPAGRKAVSTRWVYKLKRRADGTPERYKARWVAKGYSQRYGIDYDETFAPVVRLENLRLLLAHAAAHDLEIHQMDVDSTFLQAELDQEIYITQPDGYVSPEHPDYVCKLKKSLYGLKQAPLLWNRTIDEFLHKLGFSPTAADPCIYEREQDQRKAFISLYVDDCVVIADRRDIDPIKRALASKFPTKDLGEATSILGIEIVRDREQGRLYLRQKGHIEGLCAKFTMATTRPVSTPLPAGTHLSKSADRDDEDLQLPYRQLTGKLLYIAIATRPDIAFAASYLSRFNSAFTREHWTAAKSVVRYLATTKYYSICYERTNTPRLIVLNSQSESSLWTIER
jgi:hypothetical protein